MDAAKGMAVENLFFGGNKLQTRGHQKKVWERTVRPVPIFRDLGFAQIICQKMSVPLRLFGA